MSDWPGAASGVAGLVQLSDGNGGMTSVAGLTYTSGTLQTPGPIVVPIGGVTSCSVQFASDPNTGFYSPGADQLNLVTAGADRILIDAAGRVGVGPSGIGVASMFKVGGAHGGTATTLVGMNANPTFPSTTTVAGQALSITGVTAATAFTMTTLYGIVVNDASKGAGSTISNLYGIYVSAQTQGGNNYGVVIDASSTYTLQISPSGGTTAAAGVTFGTDTNLYRGAANWLMTDDSFAIGDNSNANMTLGFTINQGANDDQILAFKSSDVAHGITSLVETDTYGELMKQVANDGGLRIRGYTETSGALSLVGIATTTDTTKSTSGSAAVNITAALKSGTSAGDMSTDAGLVAIKNNSTTRWIVDAEGDTWQSGSMTATGAFFTGNASTDYIFFMSVTGDSDYRFIYTAAGQFEWGPGNATRDVGIRRESAGSLRVFTGTYFNALEFRVGGTSGPIVFTGTGAPSGADGRPQGTIYMRTDGGSTTTLYVKTGASTYTAK